MNFYDLHPPAAIGGGPWAFSSITKLVAHPQFPVTRRTIERAVAAAGYPATIQGWRIERREMNPTTKSPAP